MAESSNTEQTLMENCTLWAVPSSGWTGTDKLQPEDIGKSEEEIPDIFSLGTKKLLPYEVRVRLNRPRNKIAGFMRKMGKPFILRGVTVVPNKNLAITKAGIDAIVEEQNELVDHFLGRYHSIRAEQILRYPFLADADWPDADRIRKAFDIKVIVFEISNTKAKKSDPDELIAIKEEYANQYKESLDELKEVLIGEAHATIINNCTEIADRIINQTGKITEATLKKPRNLIKEYEDIASLFDIDEIKLKVAELKSVMANVSAKEIKNSAVVAENFAYAVKTIGEDIGGLSGINESGQVKRIVKMAKAA